MQKDDVIYRQAAIDALEAKKDKSAKGDIGCFYNTIIQNNIDALKGLPSAQPERKTGKWIFEERKRLVDETDDGAVYRTEKWWSCSECGYTKGYHISKPSSNYCENCGSPILKEGEG